MSARFSGSEGASPRPGPSVCTEHGYIANLCSRASSFESRCLCGFYLVNLMQECQRFIQGRVFLENKHCHCQRRTHTHALYLSVCLSVCLSVSLTHTRHAHKVALHSFAFNDQFQRVPQRPRWSSAPRSLWEPDVKTPPVEQPVLSGSRVGWPDLVQGPILGGTKLRGRWIS